MAARLQKRRIHVVLVGFESVDLAVGGFFASTSMKCFREGIVNA